MATRWRWHPFKLKNMKFSLTFVNFRYFLVDFDEFLPNFR